MHQYLSSPGCREFLAREFLVNRYLIRITLERLEIAVLISFLHILRFPTMFRIQWHVGKQDVIKKRRDGSRMVFWRSFPFLPTLACCCLTCQRGLSLFQVFGCLALPWGRGGGGGESGAGMRNLASPSVALLVFSFPWCPFAMLSCTLLNRNGYDLLSPWCSAEASMCFMHRLKLNILKGKFHPSLQLRDFLAE